MNIKKMLKFALRRNLIYPLQLLIWNTLRDIESFLIDYFFDIDDLALYTPLMFLGEFLAGLIFYLYQRHFLSKGKSKKPIGFMSIEFIQTEEIFAKDNDFKILFLIFTSAFSDFIQYIISIHLSKFITLSGSLELRLNGTYTINNAFFSYFALRLPIYRHQSFSLKIIGICLLIIILTEFIFQQYNIFLSFGQFILSLFFIFIIQFISALEVSTEKYLFEYNKISPFLVLMLEGFFGLICCTYFIFNNPLIDVIKFKKNKSSTEFIFLIIALCFYCILCGGKNLFRVVTTKIYTPMTTTFMEYILNPFYIIYYFVFGNDFISYGKKNVAYFVINLIVALVLTFCGCVFNEFLILFCCKLEKETHDQIVLRAMIDNDDNIFNVNYDDDETEV